MTKSSKGRNTPGLSHEIWRGLGMMMAFHRSDVKHEASLFGPDTSGMFCINKSWDNLPSWLW